MYDTPNAGLETFRIGTVISAAWAIYADWVTQHGAVVLTTVALVYAVFQFWARRREHIALMRKYAKEEDNEREPRSRE